MKKSTVICILTLFIFETYAHPKPEEYPISQVKDSSIKDEPVKNSLESSLQPSSEPINSQKHSTLGLLDRSPTYYQDMFNIPIAALQAVGNFLTGSYIPNNSSIRPIVKDAQSSLLKSSLLHQETDKLTLKGTHADASQTDINQLTKPHIAITRIPTMQDILNIPISTLQAVSHFLATNYGAPTQNISTVKISSTSGGNSNTKESQISSILKSSLISEVSVETTSQSTISEAAVSGSVSAGAIQLSQQLLQTNPSYYQDIFNIPISILQSISNFLTNTYINRNSTVAATTQRITEYSTPTSSASVKSLNPQVSEETKSSQNSIDKAPVKSIQVVHGPIKETTKDTKSSAEEPTKMLKEEKM